jgi:hypothetical protein
MSLHILKNSMCKWCGKFGRKLLSVKGPQSDADKCAIDYIVEAQEKGEINEANVLYIIENINVAGTRCNA